MKTKKTYKTENEEKLCLFEKFGLWSVNLLEKATEKWYGFFIIIFFLPIMCLIGIISLIISILFPFEFF